MSRSPSASRTPQPSQRGATAGAAASRHPGTGIKRRRSIRSAPLTFPKPGTQRVSRARGKNRTSWRFYPRPSCPAELCRLRSGEGIRLLLRPDQIVLDLKDGVLPRVDLCRCDDRAVRERLKSEEPQSDLTFIDWSAAG